MKLVLPIDPFNLTQGFGENPQAYAQFGLKGHNGWDIKTKYSDTPDGKRSILAPQDADFYKKGDEGTKGFGRYIEILTTTSKTKWKHTFAHCDSVDNFVNRKQGEKIAISDNTGNSTGAHLHWTVKRMNSDGTVKDYNNGYFGAVNPQEYVDEVRADINNSTDPMQDKQLADEMRKLITHNSSYKDAASVLSAIDKLNDAIGQKDQVIDNQNKLINERNRTITELQGQISSLNTQVTSIQSQYDTAQEQAKKVPALEESNKLLEEQKKKWIDDEQGYLKKITVLNKKIEQFKSPIKKLLVQILETLQNK